MERKTMRKKSIKDIRIQRAVTGLLVPLLQVTALYRFAEQRIAEGATDEQLAASCAEFIAART
jgi:hypothetical protein